MVSDTQGKDSDHTTTDKTLSLRASRRNLIIAGGVGAAVIVVGGAAYFLATPPGQPQQETAPTPTPTPTPTPAPAPPQMSEMDKLIEAAKKEGEVVMYADTKPGEIQKSIDKTFRLGTFL